MELTEDKLKTYDDYAKLPEGAPYQLIDGELVMSPSPESMHQLVSLRFTINLSTFVFQRKLGIVLYSPLDVYLGEHETYQPDIVFISRGRLDIITRTRIEGPPDLVAEILSPATGYYDLAHKKDIYEQTGVKEYWILDPKGKFVEIFWNDNGRFVTLAKHRERGAVESRLLSGFSVDVAALFAPLQT
jgi:Uma2 family endonuclease